MRTQVLLKQLKIAIAKHLKHKRIGAAQLKKRTVLGVGVAAVAAVLTGVLGSLFSLSTGAAIAGGFVGVATGAGAANVTYNTVRDLQNSRRKHSRS